MVKKKKRYQGGGFLPTSLYQKTLFQNPPEVPDSLRNFPGIKPTAPVAGGVVDPEAPAAGGFDAAGLISPLINLGVGIHSLFQARKQKKKQRAMEKAYNQDIKDRLSTAQAEDYYYSPYAMQQGGQIGSFFDFYAQQEQQKAMTQDQIEGQYEMNNLQALQAWKQKRQQGWSSVLEGAVGIAQSVIPGMQAGGYMPGTIIPESTRIQPEALGKVDLDRIKFGTDEENRLALEQMRQQDLAQEQARTSVSPQVLLRAHERLEENKRRRAKGLPLKMGPRYREKGGGGYLFQEGGQTAPLQDSSQDLYSPDFDPMKFLGVTADVEAANVENQETSAMQDWVLSDDGFDDPEQAYQQEATQNYFASTPEGVIGEIGAHESGGNYEAVNTSGGDQAIYATGKYQFVPKFWAPKIREFMGLGNMSESQVMEAFRQNPEAQEAFMQKTVQQDYMPVVEQYREQGKRYGFSDGDMIKLLHYRGVADFQNRMRTGDWTTVSARERRLYNNPSPIDYIRGRR
jgi:hypothetical protein